MTLEELEAEHDCQIFIVPTVLKRSVLFRPLIVKWFNNPIIFYYDFEIEGWNRCYYSECWKSHSELYGFETRQEAIEAIKTAIQNELLNI